MGFFLSDPWLAAIGLMNPMVFCALAAWKHKQFLREHFMYRHKGQFMPILKHRTLKFLSKNMLVNCEKLLQVRNKITSPKISTIFPLQFFNEDHHWGFRLYIIFSTLYSAICLFLMFICLILRWWSSSSCFFHCGVKVKLNATGESQKM